MLVTGKEELVADSPQHAMPGREGRLAHGLDRRV